MATEPEIDSATSTYAGAKVLNGIVWVLMTLLYLASATGHGSSDGLVYILQLGLAAGVGMVVNLGLCSYNFLKGYQKQALAYFIGFVPLAAIFLWILDGFRHIGKMSG